MKHPNRMETTYAHGYTLIEMLMVIAITLLITPVLYASIDSLYDAHANSLATSFALTRASKGVEEVVRNVRAAVYGEDGALPLDSIATSSVIFYSDTDMDGRVERVRYFLQGTELAKGVVEPTSSSSYPIHTEVLSVVTYDVVNGETGTPLFRFYSATSTEITTSARMMDIRRVEVTVTGQSRFRGRTQQITLSSSASIRNLKDSY